MKRLNRPFKLLQIAGVLSSTLWASPAQAWWSPDWAIRKQVTIDATSKEAAISGPVENATVLIRLHDGNFQFANAAEDGSDIRLIATDDKTPLSFHIEKYDSLLSEGFIWVKLPEVKAGEKTTFWLYYSHGKGQAERVENAKATYADQADLVFHFAEQGSAPNDASGNGNNADKAGISSSGAMVGSGLRLAGAAPLSIAPAPSLEWNRGGTLSWSAWIKPADHQSNAILFSRRDGGNAFVIGFDEGVPYVEVTEGGAVQRGSAKEPLSVNSWHHLAFVAANGEIAIYVDGEPVSPLAASLPGLKAALLLGGDSAEISGANSFLGEIDELQISKIPLSPAAIKFASLVQGGDKASLLLSIGEDEMPKGLFDFMNGGFMGIIMGSLTIDGWIVIGILVVMFIISWWVMLSKVGYLNRVAKANLIFVEEWEHVAGNFAILDQGDDAHVQNLGGRISDQRQKEFLSSTVYRIYHQGVKEVRTRVAADRARGSKKGLSGRSMSAIRASLDGSFVREMARLNSNMVLLTIAISGGPFLGLLGTVVGVMITFAAVAEAGDVNVNAIAPGIAAALAATVAGLAVAIPALFGYNYLLSRVKEASTAMQIFIDEFITKAGEFYDNAQ